MVSARKEGNVVQRITKNIKKTIADIAKKSASIEANTACPIMNYQPKEPQNVKKLRKF